MKPKKNKLYPIRVKVVAVIEITVSAVNKKAAEDFAKGYKPSEFFERWTIESGEVSLLKNNNSGETCI